MSNSLWRRRLAPFAVASMLAATAGFGSLLAPPRAAAIICGPATPCYTFAIALSGTGQSEVLGDSGIDCKINGTVITGICSARFYGGATVNFTVESLSYTCTTMLAGSECGDVLPAQWPMNGKSETYDINVAYQQALQVQVQKGGTGSGRVTSTTYPSIDCGTVCVGSQPGFTTDTLQETPDAGSVFAGWGLLCTGTSTTCSFARTSTVAVVVTASFDKVATPPPTPSPTPKPTPTPTAAPTRTPGASASPAPGATSTPAPGQTPAGSPAAGPSPTPPPTPGATFDAGASPVASASPGATPGDTAGATAAAAVTNGPTDSGAPLVPASSNGDGGVPPWLVLGLLALVIVAGAAALAARTRMRGREKG